MDDKAKVLELYEKMNHISIDFDSLIESVSIFKHDLDLNIKVDNKVICSEEITKCEDSLKNVNNSIKYDTLKDIKDYL